MAKRFLGSALLASALIVAPLGAVSFAQSNGQLGYNGSTPARQMDITNSYVGARALGLATRVVTAAGGVTVSNSDLVVEINKGTGAATAVTLPTPLGAGETHVIVDGKGDAATNNITITPAAGNISGAATYVIAANKGAARLTYDGTQWVVW